MATKSNSRRRFIGMALGMTAVGLSTRLSGFPAIIKNLGKPNSVFNGVQVGVISYSWRTLPSSAEQVLKYCVDCGISALELMGPAAESFAGAPARPEFVRTNELTDEQKELMKGYNQSMRAWRSEVSMKKFEQLKQLYDQAGVKIYAFKPAAFGPANTDTEVDYGFRAAKALGASHVTVELPRDSAQTLRLGQAASKHKMRIAYHGHLQQTLTAWDTALAQSPGNAINFDIGHYVAAGHDPMPLLESRNKEIMSMHLKDRKSKDNGGNNMPWGEGDTPIVKTLQMMRDRRYQFPATIELEYPIPAASDAIKETVRCVEFAKAVLLKN